MLQEERGNYLSLVRSRRIKEYGKNKSNLKMIPIHKNQGGKLPFWREDSQELIKRFQRQTFLKFHIHLSKAFQVRSKWTIMKWIKPSGIQWTEHILVNKSISIPEICRIFLTKSMMELQKSSTLGPNTVLQCTSLPRNQNCEITRNRCNTKQKNQLLFPDKNQHNAPMLFVGIV